MSKEKLVKNEIIHLEYGDYDCFADFIPEELLVEYAFLESCYTVRCRFVKEPTKTINLCFDKDRYELVNF